MDEVKPELSEREKKFIREAPRWLFDLVTYLMLVPVVLLGGFILYLLYLVIFVL